ncbi:MAG: transglutaminase family protein, partial [Anaerotignum sp.]|nr:transglutaminase family protein [Anaerotignum sp.]
MFNRKKIRKIIATALACLLLFTDCAGSLLPSGGLNQVQAEGNKVAAESQMLTEGNRTTAESQTLTEGSRATAESQMQAEGNKVTAAEYLNQAEESYTDYRTKAEELGTPLAVYNYLKNNIHYEYYSGRRKGAQAVYDSLGGNDVDQAVLLTEMLNHLGYDTRYVQGKIRLYPEKLQALTGEADTMKAADILAMSGNAAAICDPSGVPLYVETDHVWVEACLPYGDYRGNGTKEGAKLWIPLDTGIKRYEQTETIYDHYEEYGIVP